jgi:hypothetical protein
MNHCSSHSNVTHVPRRSQNLQWNGIAWWQGYKATPGLDAFRQHERYAAWIHTHQRLVNQDVQYASETRWFWIQILLCNALALGFWAWLGLAASAITFALASATLVCCREQRRRNLAIAEQLKVPA